MRVIFEETGNFAALIEAFTELANMPETQGIMILACEANDWQFDEVEHWLKSSATPIFGGVFPQIVSGVKNYEKGTILVAFKEKLEIFTVKGLGDTTINFEDQLTPYADQWQPPEKEGSETFIVFVDGLSKRIADLVETMFYCFGLSRNYIGGGAGSLSFKQKPCLFCQQGFLQDAAVVARLDATCGTGVAHGWQTISDSMKVTGSEGNKLKTLEWQPAFQVYQQLIKDFSGKIFTDDNFFEIAKSFPFGITRLDTEVVVRDPLMKGPSDSLICVGEIPAGSFVRLLNGRPETLIEAATKARQLAESNVADLPESANAFIIDCISRVLFLEDRIAEELSAAAGSHRMFGAMTLGEIANNGRDYLEFFNKTTVIGIFSDKSEPER
ncbi:MAG TPA: histidine kinase [Candidatus Riflebacteria bacterium]|jgi:hypothetical protein|nr:histidine kinase [Candidatus Riflebacteria bacterium]